MMVGTTRLKTPKIRDTAQIGRAPGGPRPSWRLPCRIPSAAAAPPLLYASPALPCVRAAANCRRCAPHDRSASCRRSLHHNARSLPTTQASPSPTGPTRAPVSLEQMTPTPRSPPLLRTSPPASRNIRRSRCPPSIQYYRYCLLNRSPRTFPPLSYRKRPHPSLDPLRSPATALPNSTPYHAPHLALLDRFLAAPPPRNYSGSTSPGHPTRAICMPRKSDPKEKKIELRISQLPTRSFPCSYSLLHGKRPFPF